MSAVPTIEFLEGVPESLSNVSLRRGKTSGTRTVLFTFDTLNALEILNSFTKKSVGGMRLRDEEGDISVEQANLRIIYGGDEGDELRRVECDFEIPQHDHWERFMRFMHRYADANGFAYVEKPSAS